ncbi:hypothetical protein ACFLRB_01630 [Acidobacteriota bacterium]
MFLTKKKEKKINFTIVLILMICCLSLFIFSSETQKGWKTYKVDKWSISFPGNWNSDEKAGVWWPGEGNLNMGRPAISVHIGGMPLLPGRSFDERVKSRMNAEPKDKKKVTVCGLSGFRCNWEFNKIKHLGIFIEEKIGGGMSVIRFVDCQAPVNVYAKHQADFENIIASFSCK